MILGDVHANKQTIPAIKARNAFPPTRNIARNIENITLHNISFIRKTIPITKEINRINEKLIELENGDIFIIDIIEMNIKIIPKIFTVISIV